MIWAEVADVAVGPPLQRLEPLACALVHCLPSVSVYQYTGTSLIRNYPPFRTTVGP